MATHEKNIGGRSFAFRRCSATTALDIELSLAKVGASELGNFDWAALSGLAGNDDAIKLAIGTQIGGIVGGIAQKLSLAELKRLMVLVFNHVDCDGKTIADDIDQVFADRPGDIWTAFIEGLKVNLGPLGDVLQVASKGGSSTAKVNRK